MDTHHWLSTRHLTVAAIRKHLELSFVIDPDRLHLYMTRTALLLARNHGWLAGSGQISDEEHL